MTESPADTKKSIYKGKPSGGYKGKNWRSSKNRMKSSTIRQDIISTFKGTVEAMNGHTFECHGESINSTQYSRTCEELISYASINYKFGSDIQYMIKNMTDYQAVLPVDPEDSATKTEFRIWEKSVDEYVARKSKYAQNKASLYTVIWSQCSEAMQAKIKSLPNYILFEEEGDCLTLLKEIKGISFKFESQKYIYLAMDDAKTAFYTYKQGRKETNAEFLTNFKSLVEVIEHYGGTFGNDTTLKNEELRRIGVTVDDSPTTYEIANALSMSKERTCAMAFLKRADPNRYEMLLTELENNYTRGFDQYPADMTSAYNLLVNYKTINKDKYKGNETSEVAFLNTEPPIEEIVCYRCGKEGHYASSCTEKGTDTVKKKKKVVIQPPPSGESAIQMLCLAADDDDDDGLEFQFTNISEEIQDHSQVAPLTTTQQIILKQGKAVNQNWILLDSQSTVNLFSNPKLLKNIHESNDNGIQCHCNGGVQTTTQIGTLPGYGEVWHNPSSLANILSLSHVTKRFKVTFDSSKEQAFIVHKDDGNDLKFKQSKNGLYYYDVRSRRLRSDTILVNTVEENKKLFTKRQLKKADIAKRLYSMVGRPSTVDFHSMILNNHLKNCPIEIADAKNAVKIYGPDLGALKGKTTRQPTTHVNSSLIVPLPKEILNMHKAVTLSADIFFVDKMIIFTTISRNIMFTTVEGIANRKYTTIFPCIKKVNNLYRLRGFRLRLLLTDEEFRGLAEPLLDIGIELNDVSANEHVPEVERNIRFIKERVRSTLSTLPYKTMPKIMKTQLIQREVTWINMFPRKGSISTSLSPRTLVHGTTADFKLHCRAPFGSYCQTHEEPSPTNTTKPRTIGAIAMTAQGNLQGGYNFMSLDTGKRLTRRSWTELPMTQAVIERVEALAAHETRKDPNPGNFVFRFRNKQEIIDIPPPDQDDHEDEGATHPNNHAGQDEDEDDEDADLPLLVPIGDNSDSDSDSDSESDNDHDDSDDDSDSDNEEENDSDSDNDEEEDEMLPLLAPGEYSDSDSDDSDDDSDSDDEEDNDKDSNEIEEASSGSNTTIVLESDHLHGPEVEMSLPEPIIQVKDKTKMETATTNAQQQGAQQDEHPEDKTENESEPPTHNYNLRPRKPIDYSYKRDHLMAIVLTQMSAKKGLQKFGEKAAEAIVAEFKQLDDKNVFKPRKQSSLSSEEVRRALQAITLIKEKRCGKIKGRTVADGSKQRLYTSEEEAACPTVSTEALLLSCTIDATEGRDVATADIEGAFLQVNMDELVIMVFQGPMVDLLIRTNPLYKDFVHTTAKGKRVIYVELIKAIYGCMKSGRLFWEHLSTVLLDMGFKVNDYDMCVANKIINGKQCTVLWHVDDLKISHAHSKVVTSIIDQLELIYGKMTVTRGNKHTYVGMDIIYNDDKTVFICMKQYLKEAIEDFPEDIDRIVISPAALHLFEVDDASPKLQEMKREVFHRIVAKLLFVSKRGRPDIQVANAFLGTRTTKADEDDWKKLKRLLQYLQSTIDLKLTLSALSLAIIKWWVDASYAVHADMKSHTGGCMSLGRGMIYSKSTKQKLNTKSSTESELVGASDLVNQIVWTKYFLEEQGYSTGPSLLHQDNKSAILLENNGMASSSQRTRHINVRYYFIKDRIEKKEISVVYCPTDKMIGDYYTKPLQGSKFVEFRNIVLGIETVDSINQERVG